MPVAFNNFELITEYMPKAVDKYFAADAKSAVLEQAGKFIDVNFKEKGYVKIADFLLDGLSDYYRANSSQSGAYADYANYSGNIDTNYRDGFQMGSTSLNWEIFKLQWCRGKEFKVDYIEDEETAGVVIGNLIEEFNRLKVIPEVDACRFSTISDACSASLGNLHSGVIATNEVIGAFNTAFEWMTEMGVPMDQQLIFINPSLMTKIRTTNELTHFLTQGDYRNGNGIDFTVEKYAERPIIEVPSDRFFNKIITTNNGYRPASDSKVINFMVVAAKAVVPIRKLEWSKIYGPEMSGIVGFHGYIVNYLLYHGLIIPKNKVPGIYTSLSTTEATTKSSTLRVDTREGSTQYYWKLKAIYTNPAGMRGFVVINTQAFTLGNTLSGTEVTSTGDLGSGKYMVVDEGAEVVEAAGSKAYYFALVDSTGRIIATSASQVTVVQHA